MIKADHNSLVEINLTTSSLPHRQLRKFYIDDECEVLGSLPHRQLRKYAKKLGANNQGSLPHRQLRNKKNMVRVMGYEFTAA